MKKRSEVYHPVMKTPEDIPQVKLSDGFDPSQLQDGWGVGGYNEKRPGMYTAPQYKNERYIHMGVDIWAPAGEPVYAPADGILLYQKNNDQAGNYGPTIVLKHQLSDQTIFALYGHLSESSLELHKERDPVKSGEMIGRLGSENENGGWIPHLHYQISVEDPGEADMPGVVAEADHERALELYPDPNRILGYTD